MRTIVMIALVAVVVLLTGCDMFWGDPDSFRDANRARRLMALAAEEAGQVDEPAQRLTRQLTIADMQIDRGCRADARATLAEARATLTASAVKLDEHTHIAGWVSLSELSRKAKDKAGANSACDRAIELLRAIDAPADRCQYVRGVAAEVRHLRGDRASAELLRESGAWASAIRDEALRREALAAIAADLFGCDDYDDGQAMLRRDDDPAWRSDTLTQLARDATPYQKYGKSLGFQGFFLSGSSVSK